MVLTSVPFATLCPEDRVHDKVIAGLLPTPFADNEETDQRAYAGRLT
jgi:hypothetical protein